MHFLQRAITSSCSYYPLVYTLTPYEAQIRNSQESFVPARFSDHVCSDWRGSARLTERSPFTPHRKVTIPPNPLLFTPYLGFWSELLGMGDFYYALGIQIIETCFATVFFMTETHLGCTETPCGLYPDPNSNPNYTPYPNPVLVALLSYFSWMLLLSTAQQKWRINGTRDIVE